MNGNIGDGLPWYLAQSVTLSSQRDSFGKFGLLALKLWTGYLIRELVVAMKTPILVCESHSPPMQWVSS